MRKEIFINMEKETYNGDVLDIGFENYGIVYNLYKKYNDISTVEYINGREEKTFLKEDSYDNCVLLFTLSSIWLGRDKKSLFRDISKYLKEDGCVHIWDIDKGYRSTYVAKIKMFLPERKIREIKVRDLNVFKDSSKENALKLMVEYFEVVDFKVVNNIYYIKGRKKGSNTNEGSVNSG